MATTKKKSGPSKYKVKPKSHFQDTLSLNLNHIVSELEAAKANNGGKIPYGGINKIVQQMQPMLPWLTKTLIQNQLRKLNAGVLDGQGYHGHEDSLSSLAGDSRWMTSQGTLSTLTYQESATTEDSSFSDGNKSRNSTKGKEEMEEAVSSLKMRATMITTLTQQF